MAEDKDKQGNELLGQDFLGDMQKNVDSMPTTGLFDKLAKLGAQQRLQPLADQKRFESGYKPLLKMVEDAEDRVTAGMLAYKLANPDIDDSKLHGGVGDLVTNTMTENNARFKELNRQLAYMSPRNPKYADLVAEIADINKNSLDLRDQNAKLMEIKNTMNDANFNLEEMSKGNAPGVKNMYSDIQQGVSDNFQTIDGKLYWVDPNPDIADDDPDKRISIESIKAGTPEMTYGAAFDSHIDMLAAVSDMPAESPNYDQNIHYQVNNMFSDLGQGGVKSLIFDSEHSLEDDEGNLVGYSKNGDMFNTSNWFNKFYEDLGVTDSNEMIDVRQAIQKNGVNHKIKGADGKEIKVIDHFRKWYTDELKKVEKSEKGKPKGSTNPLDDYEETRNDEEEVKVELPKTDSDNNYEGQTGSGENRYANSPFSGLTQYGWTAVDDIKNNDILFNYGDGDLVVNTLTNNYGSYGFTFKEGGTIEDTLTVVYQNPNDPDDPKNGKEITVEFDNTRAKPLNAINKSAFGVKDKDEDEAKKLKEWMETMINWSAPKE
jgi:hypothetical protein